MGESYAIDECGLMIIMMNKQSLYFACNGSFMVHTHAFFCFLKENPQKYPLGLKCLEQTMWDEAKCIQQNVPKGVICAEESSFSTPSS